MKQNLVLVMRFAFISTEWIYSIKVNTRIPKHDDSSITVSISLFVSSGSEQNHPSEAIMHQIQVIAEKIQKHFNFQGYKTRAMLLD